MCMTDYISLNGIETELRNIRRELERRDEK